MSNGMLFMDDTANYITEVNYLKLFI